MLGEGMIKGIAVTAKNFLGSYVSEGTAGLAWTDLSTSPGVTRS